LFQSLASATDAYVRRGHSLTDFDLQKYVRSRGLSIVADTNHYVDGEVSRLPQSKQPSAGQRASLVRGLKSIVRLEAETAGSLLDYAISTNIDVRLDSEFSRLFPFQSREINLNAQPLGFSRGAKPDFLFANIVGDIKTGELKEFHKLTLAAYALAYEYHERQPMNFGVLLNVGFSKKRNVPIYEKTECVVVSDVLRKAFLEKRNEKFRIIRDRADPGDSADRDSCSDCPYYPGCRRVR